MPRYCAVFTTFFEGKLTRPYENPLIACVLCLHPPFWERFRYQTPDTVCRIIKVISAAGTVSTSSLNLLRAPAKSDVRRVRAFGEMVAVLWARGDQAATVRLEHLWHNLCQRHEFSLFCTYPKAGFTRNVSESIRKGKE